MSIEYSLLIRSIFFVCSDLKYNCSEPKIIRQIILKFWALLTLIFLQKESVFTYSYMNGSIPHITWMATPHPNTHIPTNTHSQTDTHTHTHIHNPHPNLDLFYREGLQWPHELHSSFSIRLMHIWELLFLLLIYIGSYDWYHWFVWYTLGAAIGSFELLMEHPNSHVSVPVISHSLSFCSLFSHSLYICVGAYASMYLFTFSLPLQYFCVVGIVLFAFVGCGKVSLIWSAVGPNFLAKSNGWKL